MTDVYFSVKHTVTDVTISGVMDIKDADDEKPLRFFDSVNNEGWYVPSNPYDMDRNYDMWLDYELCSTAIGTCDIPQYLVDFANEQKEIILDEPTDGGEIILIIN